jgi:NAD+ synthase (glutamine-hydrolysing)
MSGQLGQLRVALAQVNPSVGDLAKNSALIVEYAVKAKNAGAHLVLFPEMVVTGYPVEDLALRKTFRAASIKAIGDLAISISDAAGTDILAAVGYLDESVDGKPQNALALIHGGKVVAKYVKHHLPNYGVFDEYRNFVSGSNTTVVRFKGVDIGMAICEDIWISNGPVSELAIRKPGLVIVPNGSPFERAKNDVRSQLVRERAAQIGAPLVYANMTGAQDDLVFDGDSIVSDANGQIIARAPQFFDGLMVVDLDLKLGSSNPDLIISEAPVSRYEKISHGRALPMSDYGQVWQALTIGLRDYVEKNGFKSVLLGMSGGIDSALVAAIAADAIGADRVFGVMMPSKYSSEHSLSDAEESAKLIGMNLRKVEIEPMVSAYLNSLGLTGLAEENLQARVRGTTLMGISNQEGHLVLATGNKSELSVGYSTLYGDAVGGFAPIKDLFKTDVWTISQWRNQKAIEQGAVPPIPENSIRKEPSAELRPDQKDTDSLPDYKELDQVLHIYIEQDGGLEGVLAAGFSKELATRVIRLVDMAEYKRRQYPPGTKVSRRAFGKDRRLPITSIWREEI